MGFAYGFWVVLDFWDWLLVRDWTVVVDGGHWVKFIYRGVLFGFVLVPWEGVE